MNIRNKIEETLLTIRTGVPIKIANEGKPIEQVTIRYKDFYLFIDIDAQSESPTGGFGWAKDPTMNPTMSIRDIWIAVPPKKETQNGKA